MFAVGDILISDELLEAPFACRLSACHGACCVQGDSGAPLEPEERAVLEQVLPAVRPLLRPEALAVIDERGVWEETEDGTYATPCIDDAECVFVVYDGPVALCGIQRAYQQGLIDFEKPISCHLFPLRATTYGTLEVLNYEQVPVCDPGRAHGCREGVQLADFLQRPLVRKYGTAWYDAFRAAWDRRRKELS
ncbi:MAG: DUF3109 family protein [Bacteroidetes bacterium]|nr:MAG: DUF3109 family protein [Bacteroidota bacterium]